ncbi:accessory gene regulator B family protein [Clostridium butyricum]|uniref:accessory gene regulator B family protein n=2 Tax=Clostridium butyricum TaxID=1492 RepID=UPI0013D77D0E|nr:accessory gene regulator B family protein [Clostridium butyricum]MCQ2017698.1 accessory gene regulator B family protein [Clostridium butyricum]MCQ2023885.1 accessory gene regulator B family protein [Clostridium butyricum]MDB2155062.1 accessory gene regulator B family protein [Clostridium butyricum]NFB73382.1 hypothetical protein [Clostridium butyricum]NFB92829.1 hypothetical protein [Clostridium butyricum]
MRKKNNNDDIINFLLQTIEYIKYILFVVGIYIIVGLAAEFNDIVIKSFLCIVATAVYYLIYNWIDISFIKTVKAQQKRLKEKQLKKNKYWYILFMILIALLILTNNSRFAACISYSILTLNMFMLIWLFK